MTAIPAVLPRATVSTRTLLAAGLVAGPLYVTVSLAQALTRDAFDLTRHPWSALANGDLGWVQMANLAGTGLLVLACAAGLARTGAGRVAPVGLAVFGAGMLVAAGLPADPVLGFPAGTPADYQEISGTGVGHMMAAGIGFAGAVVACFALARRYAAAGQRGPAVASRAVGAFFLVSFIGLGASGSRPGIVAFTLGVVALFGWIAAVAHSRR